MKFCQNVTTSGVYDVKWVLLLYKFPIYIEIFERNVFCSFYVISIFGNIIKVGVFNADIVHMIIVVETDNKDTKFALFTGYILRTNTFSISPPRQVLVLMRITRSRSGLSILQFSTYRLRYPPEISLPMTTPPCPFFI